MFLIDKYTPKSLKDVVFHTEIYDMLKLISSDKEIPHIIFYGPEGSGKRTMLNIFLELLFDETVHETKNVIYDVTGSGNKTTREPIKQSNYHIILEPKGNHSDRYLIHDVVKDYARRRPINAHITNKNFKLVVINNLDNLSSYAQFSLRRTMEKYSSTCRFIMWCTSLSKVIDPLVSRCECFRIKAPENKELMPYILTIANKENIDLSLSKYHNISKISNGNIKTALWLLQCYSANKLVLEKIKYFLDMFKNTIEKYITLKQTDKNSIDQIYEKLYEIDKKNNYNKKKGNKISMLVFKVMHKYVIDIVNIYTKNYSKTISDPEIFVEMYNKKNFKKIFKDLELAKGVKLDIDLETLRKCTEKILLFINNFNLMTNTQKAICQIESLILKKNFNNIQQIRNVIYNLMKTNIKSNEILIDILNKLMKNSTIPNSKKYDIMDSLAICEHKITNGRRDINHFDLSAISIMHILSKY